MFTIFKTGSGLGGKLSDAFSERFLGIFEPLHNILRCFLTQGLSWRFKQGDIDRFINRKHLILGLIFFFSDFRLGLESVVWVYKQMFKNIFSQLG